MCRKYIDGTVSETRRGKGFKKAESHSCVNSAEKMHKMGLFLHLTLAQKLAEGQDFVVASFCAPPIVPSLPPL